MNPLRNLHFACWAALALSGCAQLAIVSEKPPTYRYQPVTPGGAIIVNALAAPALGLGTTFTGSINTAGQGYPPLLKLLGIPEGCIPHGTCVLGYPAEQYHRIPTRKPLEVIWR